jgi:hypothetical protein
MLPQTSRRRYSRNGLTGGDTQPAPARGRSHETPTRGPVSGAGLAAVEAVVELGDDRLRLQRVQRSEDRVNLFFQTVSAFPGLGRAHMQEERQARDLPDELQELRLSVLQRVAADLNEVA